MASPTSEADRDPSEPLTRSRLAAMIDHAVLDPHLSRRELDPHLELAADNAVFCVFVPTRDTAYASDFLRGTGVIVGAPVGFPHGSMSSATKYAETRRALDDGASEIDVVQQIGWLRNGQDDEVEAELTEVVRLAEGRIVKVILENAYLTPDKISRSCAIAERAGASFVKTSTGFAPRGAHVDDVRLMRASVGPSVGVKASSGVRTLDTVLDMMDAGVTRFGMSATAEILRELDTRLAAGDVVTAGH